MQRHFFLESKNWTKHRPEISVIEMLSSPFAIKKTFTELPEMNWDRLHKITTSRNLFQSHSCKVVSKASCFLSISVWGVLRYPQVPIPWLLWNMSVNSLTSLIRWIMIVDEKLERIRLDFLWPSITSVCVGFAPIFWDFNMWKCYIPKWLIIYCSPIIHKLREPTQNGVI